MKILVARLTREMELENPRQRSYKHGFQDGARNTKSKMLDIFQHYLEHTCGVESEYGPTLEMKLHFHMTKYDL